MKNNQCPILLIDDDCGVREVIAENLRASGYQIREAKSAAKIYSLIKSEYAPALIITDVIMPEKDGLEVLLETKKLNPEIKVIVVSGGARNKSIDVLRYAKNLGADAVIAKPIDMQVLEEEIEKIRAAKK